MRRFAGPTTDLLVLFALFTVLRGAAGLLGVPLALAAPLAHPWTVVTSVYAHAGVGHLLANALALALVGFALERSTTRARMHAFVLGTGALAGLAQWAVGALTGGATAVLGASGGVLALYGYVLAGNPIAGGLLARVDLGRRATAALLVVVAGAVTVLTAGPGVALVAHFAGFALGLVGGRLRVLRVRNTSLK